MGFFGWYSILRLRRADDRKTVLNIESRMKELLSYAEESLHLGLESETRNYLNIALEFNKTRVGRNAELDGYLSRILLETAEKFDWPK